jgi:hypothetical protein
MRIAPQRPPLLDGNVPRASSGSAHLDTLVVVQSSVQWGWNELTTTIDIVREYQ